MPAGARLTNTTASTMSALVFHHDTRFASALNVMNGTIEQVAILLATSTGSAQNGEHQVDQGKAMCSLGWKVTRMSVE